MQSLLLFCFDIRVVGLVTEDHKYGVDHPCRAGSFYFLLRFVLEYLVPTQDFQFCNLHVSLDYTLGFDRASSEAHFYS